MLGNAGHPQESRPVENCLGQVTPMTQFVLIWGQLTFDDSILGVFRVTKPSQSPFETEDEALETITSKFQSLFRLQRRRRFSEIWNLHRNSRRRRSVHENKTGQKWRFGKIRRAAAFAAQSDSFVVDHVRQTKPVFQRCPFNCRRKQLFNLERNGRSSHCQNTASFGSCKFWRNLIDARKIGTSCSFYTSILRLSSSYSEIVKCASWF